MKYTLRVPTDMYAYIESEVEVATPEEAVEAYKRITAAVKGEEYGFGLPTKEWNAVLDKYRNGKGMSAEEMESLNEKQSWAIHELDKSDNRLKK